MVFYSRSNRPVTVACSVGAVMSPVYEERLVDGKKQLVITGETNLFEYVQASKEETLVYNLLDRFYRGDVTALTSKRGQFLDVTGMPSTLADAMQLMINANEKFAHLPKDVQAQFDNDVNKYVQEVANADVEGLKKIFGIESSGTDAVKDGESVVEK